MDLTSLIIGGAVGSYFTFVKTRKERLFEAQYEVLRDIIMDLYLMHGYFNDLLIDDRLEGLLGETLINNLSNEMPNTRHQVMRNFAKLRLLFNDRYTNKLLSLFTDLESLFFYLHNSPDNDLAKENIENIKNNIY